MRKWIVVISAVVFLIGVNFTIAGREKLLKEGQVVLLELAPVDPRSLMQGDYMALRFKVANDAFGTTDGARVTDGKIVVAVGPHGVGTFKRIDDGKPLAAGEVLMRYRVRNKQPKFGTNAFFFEEGQAKRFEVARYGEFRVAANGDMILTGMRGADYRPL